MTQKPSVSDVSSYFQSRKSITKDVYVDLKLNSSPEDQLLKFTERAKVSMFFVNLFSKIDRRTRAFRSLESSIEKHKKFNFRKYKTSYNHNQYLHLAARWLLKKNYEPNFIRITRPRRTFRLFCRPAPGPSDAERCRPFIVIVSGTVRSEYLRL